MIDAPVTLGDVVEAARALGVRDVASRGGRLVTLRTVLADAQRMRWDALHTSVALDALFPRHGCTWRPICCWCADSLDAALCEAGEDELESHRVNWNTGHDAGCCSCCDVTGPDVLVAAFPDAEFAAPTRRFLDLRCAYRDRGSRLLAQLEAMADA